MNFEKLVTMAIIANQSQQRRLNPYQVSRAHTQAQSLCRDAASFGGDGEDWDNLFALLIGFHGSYKDLPHNDLEDLSDRCDRLTKWLNQEVNTNNDA